jgi:hypothetical protein
MLFFIKEYTNGNCKKHLDTWLKQEYNSIIEDIDCWGLTMDKNGSLYVSDFKKNEVRRWKRGNPNGTIVADGNGRDDYLNQLSIPNFIFFDEHYSLYASDYGNDRVMKWFKDAKAGIVGGGGENGSGKSSFNHPGGLSFRMNKKFVESNKISDCLLIDLNICKRIK